MVFTATSDVKSYWGVLLPAAEVFRRTLWGFFRLENEHRANKHTSGRGGFVPLHFNTGHLHKYKEKKERAGLDVLRELLLVTVIVGMFWFGAVASAQRANERFPAFRSKKEL